MSKIIKKTVDKWIELYKAGSDISAIASEYGVSYWNIYTYLDKAGVLRKQTKITTKMIKEWIALYKTGNVSCSWIGRKYNVSRNTVATYLHIHGVPTSKRVPHIIEVRL